MGCHNLDLFSAFLRDSGFWINESCFWYSPPYLFTNIRRLNRICRRYILQSFFAYVQGANLSKSNYYEPIYCLTSLSAHMSQYFSMSIAPSTLNNASLVAVLPQVTQNLGFLPTSSKDLNDEKTFSILLLHSCNAFVSQTYLFSCCHESKIVTHTSV